MNSTKLHGFTLIKEENIKEINGIAKLFKHDKTGAELLSITNDDTNKCFGVNFRTPPKNSTGVAHILEHSVLCGSEKYPTKEPFVELLKSSLQTFLNAMTYPDKTCYPVASTNIQDLYNLMDVYMDAVFFPRVRTEEGKDILAQEGWHIDTTPNDDGTKGKWQFKGVVYNEMKGVYSSPDSLLGEQSQHAVFPDTLYSLDSGGNPDVIPELTYEEFEEFHKIYYHPSNARFFFWGDDGIEQEEIRLKKVNEVISRFDKLDADKIASSIPLQKMLENTSKIEVSFDAPKESDENDLRGHATVNWLLCETYDLEKNILFNMLDHILTALPGSPLRKALIDSGLGEDITGHLEEDLIQMYYSVGLRSIQTENADTMEALILDTLADLVEEGIPAKAIEAAINATEFHLREANTGRYPRGLVNMTQCLTHWLYDKDPLNAFKWETPLAKIKQAIENKEKIFENLITEYLLENNHRSLVVLMPLVGLAESKQEADESIMQAKYDSMSEEERDFVEAESARLQEVQAKEDSEEALATIPVLTLDDLAKENKVLPIEKKENILPIITHPIETTGIVYSRLVFSLDSLPYDLLPLLSLYSRALTELGTKNYNFIELGLEIEATTGGVGAYSLFQSKVNSTKTLNSFVLSGKATSDKIEKLVNIIEEIIFNPQFDNKERFTQMVLEEKARLEQAFVPAGHSFVLNRLGATQSQLGAINEYTQGISYFDFLKDLAKNLESNWPAILEKLQTIHTHIFSRDNALLDMTANNELLQKAEKCFQPLLENIQKRDYSPSKNSWNINILQGNEALIVPARVNYVGMSTNLHKHGYEFHGSALVISRFLRMGYLWDRIRVLGGAYGCFVQYSRITGSFAFVSYRDPQVEKSLSVYLNAPEFLGNLHMSPRDLSCAIIGTIGDLDGYLLPDAMGSTALWRDLTGDTKEIRQKIREEVLSTKLSDFQNFAQPLSQALKEAKCISLGGADTEKYAKTNNWTIKKLI